MAGKRRAENGDHSKDEPSKSAKEARHPDSTGGASLTASTSWHAIREACLHDSASPVVACSDLGQQCMPWTTAAGDQSQLLLRAEVPMDWREQPPYKAAEPDKEFDTTYTGACACSLPSGTSTTSTSSFIQLQATARK